MSIPRSRSGFTIIELLAASTLTALMMVLMLSVITALAARQRELRQAEVPSAWKDQLRQQIRWDLTNAEYMRSDRGAVILLGVGSCDWTTGVATQRPAEITYWVEEVEGRTWLMRRETHLDQWTNRNQRTELVCADVGHFSITAPTPALEIPGAATVNVSKKIADVVHVRLTDLEGRVLIDEELRWR